MPNDLRGTGLTTEMLNRVIKYITQGNRAIVIVADSRHIDYCRRIEPSIPRRMFMTPTQIKNGALRGANHKIYIDHYASSLLSLDDWQEIEMIRQHPDYPKDRI